MLISSTWCIIVEVISQAPVAQLDRARASDARCRKFESCQVHFLYSKIIKGDAYGVEEPERIAGFSGFSERIIIGSASVPSAELVNIYPFGVSPL